MHANKVQCQLDAFVNFNEGRFQHSWPSWLFRNPKHHHVWPLLSGGDIAIQLVSPTPTRVVGISKFEYHRVMFAKQLVWHPQAVLQHLSSSHWGFGDFKLNCAMGCWLTRNGLETQVRLQSSRQWCNPARQGVAFGLIRFFLSPGLQMVELHGKGPSDSWISHRSNTGRRTILNSQVEPCKTWWKAFD